MPERAHLSLRLIDAVEGRLRPRVSARTLRLVYRLGYRVLRPWWYLTRPEVTGVKVVVRCGEQILLVRHTYGPGQWDVPGGFMKAGEDSEVALRRELAEELGVVPVAARIIARAASRHDHRRETRITYVAELASTEVEPSIAEIAEARWFHQDDLPSGATTFTRRMVARATWDPDGGRALARLLHSAVVGSR
jgi:ADP-ribose pyrophosphatase YjhB (NUDIX family)